MNLVVVHNSKQPQQDQRAGYIRFSMTDSGRTISLHWGSQLHFFVDGREVLCAASDADKAKAFELATGVSLRR